MKEMLMEIPLNIREQVEQQVVPTLPDDYFVEYGGQFEAQQQANLRLLVLGSVSVIGVLLLLLKCLTSWRAAVASDELALSRQLAWT